LSGGLKVVEEAVGEMHGDAAGGDVDGIQPSADEGDEGWFGGFGRGIGAERLDGE
jgi:hypothetical protein